MKTNLAALALAASAAAMPMSAVDTTSSQATTATDTTTMPPLPFPVPSWISSILYPPLETTKTTTFNTVPTAAPSDVRAPDDHAVEPCVMPDGCRDNDKRQPPPPHWGTRPTRAQLTTALIVPTAAPSGVDVGDDHAVEPCVMPDGCRDNDKQDKPPPPKWGLLPTKVPTTTTTTLSTRTVSVPTETSGSDTSSSPTTANVPTETTILGWPIFLPPETSFWPVESTSTDGDFFILPFPTPSPTEA